MAVYCNRCLWRGDLTGLLLHAAQVHGRIPWREPLEVAA